MKRHPGLATMIYLAICLQTDAAEPAAFRAGFADRDITPAIGMERPGGYGKAFHTEIHDPCKVRAAVFDDGQRRVAIVGVDTLMVRRPLVEAVRRRCAERTGIAPDAIMISASHSHSSGPTGMVLPGEYDHASEFVRSLAYEHSSCANADYLKLVEDQLVEAICQADASLAAAACGVGVGLEEHVSFNRRFRMRSGLTNTNPRPGNPDMLEPAGPIDPEVGVIGAWGEDGKLLGCVVNFACHATTSPRGASANYIGYIERVVRGTFNADAVVVFLPGASGDINQIDNRSPYFPKPPEEMLALVGGRVGAEAVKALLSMERGSLAPIASSQKMLKLKRRVPSPERVAECERIARRGGGRNDTEWTFAKEILMLDARLAVAPKATVEVQAIQIGPVVLLSNPAEYFCQYGLDIKAGSDFPFTFPVSLANDGVGYVPTEEAFGPRGGGYETRLTSYSNLEPRAGRAIADACIELAKELTPGSEIAPRPAPSYEGNAWSYGNVPPELN